jgi:hypothetical protein
VYYLLLCCVLNNNSASKQQLLVVCVCRTLSFCPATARPINPRDWPHFLPSQRPELVISLLILTLRHYTDCRYRNVVTTGAQRGPSAFPTHHLNKEKGKEVKATTSAAVFSAYLHPACTPPKINPETTVISGASNAAPSILPAARHKKNGKRTTCEIHNYTASGKRGSSLTSERLGYIVIWVL